MAYVGIDGKARKITNMYVGVDGVARKIIKGYVGVDGIARLIYSASSTPGGGDEPETSNYPTLNYRGLWYRGKGLNSTEITEVEFMDSYTPTGTEDETWDADKDHLGTINGYRIGTKAIIAGNGSGKIYTNPDSSSMFSTMPILTTIKGLEVLDTSKTTNMSSMFSGCKALTSLDLSSWDVSKVENMDYFFGSCYKLTSVNLNGWNTESATTMFCMFYDCMALPSIDLRHFNVSKVQEFWCMFMSCDVLTSVDISGWNMSSADNLRRMFYCCSSLTNVNLTGWNNTNNITNFSDMFDCCSALTTLDLTSIDTSSATDMSYMFSSCRNLTTIKVSSGKWVIRDDCDTTDMFEYCGTDHVTYVDEPSPAEVPTMRGYTWYNGSIDKTTITEIEFRDTYVPTGNESESWYADVNNTGAITCYALGNKVIVAGNGSGSIKTSDCSYLFGSGSDTITTKAFSSATAIKGLSLLDTSNVTTMESMFAGCEALTSLDLSNFNTSNVINMGNMFNCCYNLTELNISSFNTSNVVDMSDMFISCQAPLDFSNFDTSKVENMSGMFMGRRSALDLSNFDTSNVTNMRVMFMNYGYSELDLSSFNTNKVENMEMMFFDASNLNTIKVSRNKWVINSNCKTTNMLMLCGTETLTYI